MNTNYVDNCFIGCWAHCVCNAILIQCANKRNWYPFRFKQYFLLKTCFRKSFSNEKTAWSNKMRLVTVRRPRLYGQTPPIQNMGTYLQKKGTWTCPNTCTHVCNVHVVPIIVLRIFSYPKFWCLTFFYDKN